MQFNFELQARAPYTYTSYREMLSGLLAEGKTTGADQSEAMLAYAKMNETRMKRWDKTAKLSEELKNLLADAPKQKWIVLSEGWCGDAAQNLPVLNKMVEESTQIDLQIILRDENLDVMDAYLTNGGRAIPKLISVDENNNVLFSWGPRPKNLQDIVVAIKKEGGDYATELHKAYAKDRGQSLQEEFVALLSKELV